MKRNTTGAIALLAFLAMLDPQAGAATSGTASGLTGSGGSGTSGTPNLSGNYQDAGNQSQNGANASAASAATWGAVAVTCGVACAMSYFSAKSLDSVCTAAGLGGAGADMALTQNLGGAFMMLGSMSAGKSLLGGGAGAGAAAGGGQAAGKAGAEAGKSGGKSHESCVTAAMAALQAAAKAMSAQQAQQAAGANQGLGAGLAGNQPKIDTNTPGASPGTNTSQGTTGVNNNNGDLPGGGTGSDNTGSGGGGSYASADPCSGNPKSSYGQMIACATKSDPGLPSIVKSDDFKNAFENVTGKPANEYFGNSPADVTAGVGAGISAGMHLDGEQSQKLGEALKKSVAALEGPSPAGSYAGGGGGGGRAPASDSGDGMGDILKTMYAQMNPEAQKSSSPGVSAIEYANQTRSPASVAEDPNLSIFDRVTYRYTIVTRGWLSGGTQPATTTR